MQKNCLQLKKVGISSLLFFLILFSCDKNNTLDMQQSINYGTAYDDPSADTKRDAFKKCDDNFNELYTASEINKVYVDIGAWDMNTSDEKYVSYSLPSGATIREFSAFINNDAETAVYPLCVGSSAGLSAGSIIYNKTNSRFELERIASSLFDSASFENLANRGFIVVYLSF